MSERPSEDHEIDERTEQVLVSRYVHGRDTLDESYVEMLVAACRRNPALAVQLHEQLMVDELLRQQLDEKRGDFVSQVEQRVRDEQSGMQGGLASLADLVPIDGDAVPDDGVESDDNGIDMREYAIRELDQYRESRDRRGGWVRVLGFVAVVLATAAVTLWLTWPADDSGVLFPTGDVQVARGREVLYPTEPFVTGPGDEIRVSADGSAVVKYADATEVVLEPGTTLSIPATGVGKQLVVSQGELRAKVSPQPAGRPMQLATPSARATVVGTEFALAVRPNGVTRLEVREGRVELARLADGKSVGVEADQYAVAAEPNGPLEVRTAEFPASEWAEQSPEEAGLSEPQVQTFAETVGGRGCIVRDGRLVHTWGDVSTHGPGSRVTEALLSHLLFLAVEDGRIDSLDDRVVVRQPLLADLGGDRKDAAITWRQLAQHTCGYGTRDAPGATFSLKGLQAGLLADTLVERVFATEWSEVDDELLQPRLVGPLQCEDRPTMSGGTPGVLRISPRDLARFGLLYLRDGRWKERRLLDRRLAAVATSSPVSNDVPVSAAKPGPTIRNQRSPWRSVEIDHFGSYSFGWWLNGVDRDGRRLLPDAPTDTVVATAIDGREALVVVPSRGLVMTYADGNRFDWKPGADNRLNQAIAALLAER